jgi:hypothetical protein
MSNALAREWKDAGLQKQTKWASTGVLRKKSGIWHLAENLQNNCNSRNWDSTLPITPDFSWLRIIGKNREKLGPDYLPIIPDCQLTFPIIPDFPRCIGIGQEFLCGVYGEAFPAGAVRPLVLRCRAHALLLTIAMVNIVTTSLKVTLRKLVMTQVFCGTRHATIADRWWRRGRTATFCRHANTWLIIAKTDHQNWLPIIPKLGIIRNYWENWDPNNSRFFPIFRDSPITRDNSQFFLRGLPNNGISLGGILFYFWSFSVKMPNSWHFAECPWSRSAWLAEVVPIGSWASHGPTRGDSGAQHINFNRWLRELGNGWDGFKI